MISATIATIPHASSRNRSRFSAWWVGAGLSCLAVVFLATVYWPFRYRNVEPLLERLLASKVTMGRYHSTFFPHPGFVAYNLVLKRNGTPGLPPIGSATSLTVRGNWSDLLLLRRRVPVVVVEDLHVVIPAAGSEESRLDFPPGSSQDFVGPSTQVGQFGVFGATLDIKREDGSRYTFPIHQLILRDMQQGRPASFVLDMENALPTGNILATGTFGPLKANDLGATPVAGSFNFAGVNLADLKGISGTLWSHGRFSGSMKAILADVQVAVPSFAVGRGSPAPVRASSHVNINSLNGDLAFQSIDVSTGSTMIHARGSIAGSVKATNLDIAVTNGRAEDLLRPFLPHGVPIQGPASLQSHLYVAPSSKGASFLDRLKMNGSFDLPAERLTDRKFERKLYIFSTRAREKNPPRLLEDAERWDGVVLPEVASSLNGRAVISHGIVTTSDLMFKVPGASLLLHGHYNLRGSAVSLLGDLETREDLSHLTTGLKSVVLKPISPFFKGRNAGAVIPIEVSGSARKYTIRQHLLHLP